MDDVSHTFARTRAAQQASWGALPVRARLAFLGPLRRLLAEEAGSLVDALEKAGGLVREPGDSVAAELFPLAEACRFLQKRAARILKPRRVPPRWLPLWFSRVGLEIHREPLGLVLVIGPGNYPLFLPGVQALQALVAGNAVAVKPGAGGKAVMDLLAAMVHRCGVDPALFTVLDESVQASRDAVEARPDKVVLTGGVATGRAVLQGLAERVVPSVMELSGCDAVFLLEGADLERAARAVAYSMRLNQGATCMAPHRVFVPAGQVEPFGALLGAEAEKLGSLSVDAKLARQALALVRAAEEGGARRITGDIQPGEAFRPVVLTGASPDMELLKADVFCPVVAVVAIDGPDHALAQAARCPFALAATVFGPERPARAFARRVNAGTVLVNDLIAPTAHPALPFGGRGLSGFGTTRGAEGLLEMTALKAVAYRRGRWLPHLDPPRKESETVLRLLLAAAHGRGAVARFRNLLRALRAARSLE